MAAWFTFKTHVTVGDASLLELCVALQSLEGKVRDGSAQTAPLTQVMT